MSIPERIAWLDALIAGMGLADVVRRGGALELGGAS